VGIWLDCTAPSALEQTPHYQKKRGARKPKPKVAKKVAFGRFSKIFHLHIESFLVVVNESLYVLVRGLQAREIHILGWQAVCPRMLSQGRTSNPPCSNGPDHSMLAAFQGSYLHGSDGTEPKCGSPVRESRRGRS
jgi:hypothetical protein